MLLYHYSEMNSSNFCLTITISTSVNSISTNLDTEHAILLKYFEIYYLEYLTKEKQCKLEKRDEKNRNK